MREKVLILVKTYPSPSKKSIETTCLAGITDAGEMRRLFPAPFRLLDEDKKFKKWQWIDIDTTLPREDKRPESRQGDFNTVQLLESIPADKGWEKRMNILRHIPRTEEFCVILEHNAQYNVPCLQPEKTLTLYIPEETPRLEIKKGADEWTPEEKEKLKQDGLSLFSREEMGLPKAPLEKIPYDFYYRFQAPFVDGQSRELRLKIIDWEISALYRNCVKDHGEDWKDYVRRKYEPLPTKAQVALMLGTMHRFNYQWLIIGVYLIPREYMASMSQGRLFDEPLGLLGED